MPTEEYAAAVLVEAEQPDRRSREDVKSAEHKDQTTQCYATLLTVNKPNLHRIELQHAEQFDALAESSPTSSQAHLLFLRGIQAKTGSQQWERVGESILNSTENFWNSNSKMIYSRCLLSVHRESV